MKKVTLLIALAALVMLAGCKKENDTKGVTLKASIQQNVGSRTSLNPIVTPTGSTAEILWTAGDKVLVNNGTSNAIFTLTAGAGSTEGTFNYAGDYSFGTSNVAVYPETATISGNTVSLTLPATQTAEAGTFGNGTNPMLGTFTDPDDLVFTSLCGVLGVSLTGDNVAITGIEIVSNNASDKLNGAFEADCTVANPALAPTTGNAGTNKVMLSCNTTLTATPQDFYFVLPVGTLAGGFTMKVYNGGNDPIFTMPSQNSQLVVELNTVKKLNTLEVEVTGGGGGDTHAYVDLGLPSGLLWATCNVGANAPEEYGDYFAWGETTPKDTYTSANYTYSDNPAILPSDHDAATANWGNGWRMPTKAEFQELLDNTTVTWTQQNGVNGRLFTATNGNSLFLPAAGYRWNGELYYVGSYGRFWSSSLYSDNPLTAWFFGFHSDYYGMSRYDRYYGQSVRAVRSGL